jgi:hypothetical protein
VQRHVFFAGPHATHRGEPLCESCGDVRDRPVHEIPEQPEEVRVIDARRLGETP